VASKPPKTAKNPNPAQYVFYSSADDNSFEVYPDPRGDTLGRGTEITLYLKEDALEYLDNSRIIALVEKHSSFSTAFPIYLFHQKTIQVPDEDAEPETKEDESAEEKSDDDEAVVEKDVEAEVKPPKMKDLVVDEW
ncbi:hypothetical protein MPER_14968, partial [Moniliophthora perniciosa FA553]